MDKLSASDGSTGTTEELSEVDTSWIAWFCGIRGNEFFCEVDEEYVHDEFNLTGLQQEVPYYDYALDLILDVDSPNSDQLTEEQQETVDAAAELLYGLVHARYILTAKGLQSMVSKTSLANYVDLTNDVTLTLCIFTYPLLLLSVREI
jgi:casein kinase II subunit beta